jgi:hypothetical protein
MFEVIIALTRKEVLSAAVQLIVMVSGKVRGI